MKKIFLTLLTFCALSASAQNTVVLGDMNNDGGVTIGDVAKVVSTALGEEPLQTIETCSCTSYQVDNTAILGTWYKNLTSTVSFNEDGTTDFKPENPNCTYEFIPSVGTLIIYNEEKVPVDIYHVHKISDNDLIFATYDRSYVYTREPHNQLVSQILLSSSAMSLNVGESKLLIATVIPGYAEDKTVIWTTSNSNIVKVDARGVITAVAPGTAAVACTSQDGGEVKARCSVFVDNIKYGDLVGKRSMLIKGVKGQTLHFDYYDVLKSGTTYYNLSVTIKKDEATTATKLIQVGGTSTTTTAKGTKTYTFGSDGYYLLEVTGCNHSVLSNIYVN